MTLWLWRARHAALQVLRADADWSIALGKDTGEGLSVGGQVQPWPSSAHRALWHRLHYGFDSTEWARLGRSALTRDLRQDPFFGDVIVPFDRAFTPVLAGGLCDSWEDWADPTSPYPNPLRRWRWHTQWVYVTHPIAGYRHPGRPGMRWPDLPGLSPWIQAFQSVENADGMTWGSQLVQALRHLEDTCPEWDPTALPHPLGRLIGAEFAALQAIGAGYVDQVDKGRAIDA